MGDAMLFDEMRIGTLTARNRAIRAATAESLATQAGRPTSRLFALYDELARGGVGTIITGYAYASRDGKPSEGALGLYDDAFLDDYRDLAKSVHDAGARIVLQLAYGGSKSKLAPDDERRLVPATETPQDWVPNVSVLGASALENLKTHLVPTEATPDDLARVAGDFGEAAARAQACGFDGVELHVAHGYLLSQFLSRWFNVRTDDYGGSLESRARFAVECMRAIRSATGPDYPVFAKVNSCDDREDPAGARGGLSEDDSARVCAWLVQAGATCIEVSGDWHSVPSRDVAGDPFFAGFGARLVRELNAPIVVTGGWRRLDTIEEHLQSGGFAGIGMSRPFIREPDLVNRWQAGRTKPSRCTACGYCQKYRGIPCVFRQ
ncbi:MAG TPA: NADH:flavin oxidoreductase [Eggerthellaceae bacterium]|nr:NADH:flavin oxidoreductase [Eggerthellaceae bacterium]